MGILQNDTANVILDAVLTDRGRQFLARGDSSFNITKFALADDEVDYTIIKKFGRTVGKEKIEKNTPVFEAITNEAYAQKFRMLSVSNPNLIRLPTLTFTGEGVDSSNRLLNIGNTTVKRRTLTISQEVQDETSIDVELRDQSFLVQVSNKLLSIVGSTPDAISSQQVSTYLLTRDAGETSTGGSRLTFTLATKAITESTFQIYGATFNKNLIRTFARVSGIQSGAVLEFEIQINKNV